MRVFFTYLKKWLRERYYRMCLLPSAMVTMVLTAFAFMTLGFPMTGGVFFKILALIAFFTFSIGSLLIVLWGIWSLLPLRLNRFERHLSSIFLVIVGVFTGTTVTVSMAAQLLGRNFYDVVRQVMLFNGLLTLIVISLMVIYEQMRTRLEITLAQLKEKEINEQRLLRLKTQAELSSLQAKINPHFLFNSLNSIASLVSIDPRRAEEAVEMLSKLLRFSLRSSEKRVVLLRDECDIVRTYLDLEKLRLGHRLEYQIELIGDVDKGCVPGMLLQPLVENSIKHGLVRKIGKGTVLVRASVEYEEGGDICRIIVADNGCGWTAKSRVGGIGIANIKERLNLYFDGRCSIEQYNRDGAVIEITFPVEGSCTVF